jgi:hypothetical protein
MNFRMDPTLTEWHMGGMPEVTYRLRWLFQQGEGAGAVRGRPSAWTPGDYPSFRAAWEGVKAHDDAGAGAFLIIEGENVETSEVHEFLSIPVQEMDGLEYVGMCTMEGASIIGALKVRLHAELVDAYVFVNGFTFLEERKGS